MPHTDSSPKLAADSAAVNPLGREPISLNPRGLARAATLVERQTQQGRDLISGLFGRTGKATIVGITGPPGAGKSTLVNQLTRHFRARGSKVGVIAVDPSSPYSNGALLGDRIRLAEHHGDPGVFIRSMATRGKLGGLARGTLEMALLLDAAGFDTILIETVGVGQDEVDIAALADVTAVVLVPGLGDDVQAIKAGIIEIAHVLVINKADLPGADRLEQELRFAQSLASDAQAVPIFRVVASEGTGVEQVVQSVTEAASKHRNEADRTEIWSLRLREMLRDALLANLNADEVKRQATRVASGSADPYEALAVLSNGILTRQAQS